MIVFYKERLVILCVPKTGTTALHSALRDRADMVISDPPGLKHTALYRYNRFIRPMYEKICGVELEPMAIMREPIDWLGSWYRYRRRPFTLGKPVSTHNVSFDEFVRGYAKGKPPAFANVGSQARFLEAQPNGTRMKHLFRYETPSKYLSFLEDRLDISLNLKRENVSPELATPLSPEVEAILRRKCAEEFDLYNSIAP